MQDSYEFPKPDAGQTTSLGETLEGETAETTPEIHFLQVNKGPAKVDYGGNSVYRLTWLMVILAFLLASTYIVPAIVQKVSYSWNLGKQQAEYAVASENLDTLPLAELSQAYQLISKKVGPSVVHINVVGSGEVSSSQFPGPLNRHRRFRSQGQGSGVIVDAAGYILTNEHVVSGANRIRVSLSDGRIVPAVVVGVDELTDLAVIKIEADDLIAVDWGDSNESDVGALVWALGSPFGLERSITFGILSAKHRSEQIGNPYQDFLQTDAAVNPGNSGGPLVDAQGRLIGINTAIVGESYQGISFAVPSNVARGIFDRLVKQGRVTRGWLGVEPVAVTADQARQLGLKEAKGAMIARVASQNGRPSPAERAGIRAGDVIVSWNGNPIDSPAQLFNQVGMTGVGETVDVVVVREGHRVTLQVSVEARIDD